MRPLSESTLVSPLRLVMAALSTLLITALLLPPASTAATTCVPGPGLSLVGCDFEGEDLEGVDFTGADLTDANFTNANLTDANLTGTNLTGTNLTDAILGGVTSGGIVDLGATLPSGWLLSRGYLVGFGANLTGADLEGADLSYATLMATILVNADLASANLANRDLTSADLTGANLTSANLSEVMLQDANLTGANLTGANLMDASLFATNLTRANLTDANLTDAYLASTTVTSANLTNATMVRVRSEGLIATSPPTLSSDWRWVTSGGYLVGPDANLTGAGLSSEDLTGANLTGANLTDAILTGATLSGANLTDAILTRTNFSIVDLIDATLLADFSDALIYQVKIGTASDYLAYTGGGAHHRGDLTVVSHGVSSSPVIPSMALGRSVTGVGFESFFNAPITAIDLGSVRSIAPNAFAGSSLSGALLLPSGVTSVEAGSFYDTDIESVQFNGRITAIGDDAFARTSIRRVTFPSSLTEIGERAFFLRSVADGIFTFEGAAPTFGDDAFAGGDGITVRYPSGAAGWADVRGMDPNPFGLNVVWEEYTPPSPPDGGGGTPIPATVDSQPVMSSPTTAEDSSTNAVPIAIGGSKLEPGATVALIGGKPVDVQQMPQRRGGVELKAGPVSFLLRSQTPAGQNVPTSPDGSLVIARTGTIPIAGSGLAPGSLVNQTLNSDPVDLGTMTVGAAGSFASNTTIPGSVPKGSHTLLLTGTTKHGDAFTLAIGVAVTSPAAALGASPTLTIAPKQVTPGGHVSARASGVQARCTVDFSLAKTSVRTTADSRGVARASISVPWGRNRNLPLTVRVSGKGCDRVVITRTLR